MMSHSAGGSEIWVGHIDGERASTTAAMVSPTLMASDIVTGSCLLAPHDS